MLELLRAHRQELPAGVQLFSLFHANPGLFSRLELLHHGRLLYTTPAHQWPLGGRLPVPRREQLLGWARATDWCSTPTP